MRGLRGFGPLLAVAIVGVIVVIMAEPISKWVAANRAAHNGMVIGRIVQAEGSVRRIHGSDIDLVPSPVADPMELRDGDRIQTSIASKAVILLNSQDEFEMASGSILQFQLWNPKDSGSPIYVHSLLGTPNLRRAGIRGKAFLVKDGRLYSPGQKPLQKPMALTVLRNAPLDLQLATGGAANSAPIDSATDSVSATDDSAATTAPPAGVEPATLSNEYIDETIVSRQGQLQKCWLTRLKDAPNLKGQIVLQFEITKRGKVKDVRTVDATIDDETLKNCVISVLERTTFRSFTGPEISISYPIKFE